MVSTGPEPLVAYVLSGPDLHPEAGSGSRGRGMTPVLLDFDLAMGAPGSDIDDGFALALAVADPEIDLRLVTTVSGNTDAATATTLTFELLDRLGGAVRPGAPGCDPGAAAPGQPVRAAAARAWPPGPPNPEHGVLALVDAVLAAPGELTLVAVGPLTNVALAMLLEPTFAESLARPGDHGRRVRRDHRAHGPAGGVQRLERPAGGAHCAAEWGDGHLGRARRHPSGPAGPRRGDGDGGGPASRSPRSPGGTRSPGSTTWRETEDPATDSCALHDPLAVAAVTRPDLLSCAEVHLDVQLDGVARGVMVADHRQPRPEDVNARIAVDVDPAGFADHFTGCLRRL